MKKQSYLKPSIEIVELLANAMIAESENIPMDGQPYDGNGGNVKGLSFDPITGISLDVNLME